MAKTETLDGKFLAVKVFKKAIVGAHACESRKDAEALLKELRDSDPDGDYHLAGLMELEETANAKPEDKA